MIVQHADMVPHVLNWLNLPAVWKWFSVKHEMIHGKSQVKPFAKIVNRKCIFGELEPGLNREAIKLPACEFLFSDDITRN